jgi:excisionase family DNA binding protein
MGIRGVQSPLLGRRKVLPGRELQKQTISIEEAAKVLGIGRNNAYAAARSGEIPTIRIGKRLLVPRAALERMLQGAA